MKKLLLIDGNSMLFRAFYATYSTNLMKTSDGIYTNAIFGFASMLKKAIDTIQPDKLMVAFDHDKNTYRYAMYPEYKGTRAKLPEELKMQFPLVREYLDALKITHHEQSGMEADDIIGTIANTSPEYEVSILTSDKDMLQLVSDKVTVWLMQKGITEMAEMTPEAVYERFGLRPQQIVDLKGLSGDPSDNIPGVRKVGDKTAIKLLTEYDSVENLYDHIDEVKGKLHDNLVEDRDLAFMSKQLAQIIIDGNVDIDLENCDYQLQSADAYNFYVRYQMRSFANKIDLTQLKKEETVKAVEGQPAYEPVKPQHLDKLTSDKIGNKAALYIDDKLTVGIVSDKGAYFGQFLKDETFRAFLADQNTVKTVYDLKRWYHIGHDKGFEIRGEIIDLMILSFLDDVKVKTFNDLISKHGLFDGERVSELSLFDLDADDEKAALDAGKLFYIEDKIVSSVKEKGMYDLYLNVELPLAEVLAEMEIQGIRVDVSVLDRIEKETEVKMEQLEHSIHTHAGHTFNINSPKQLAEVIYDELKLTRSTKRSTDAKILGKLVNAHPIIADILDYRKYSKLYSTYAHGLKKYIESDGKIHTVFNQCIAETGRLSSSDPNLQNISVRNEETQQIRAAFIPEEGCVLVGADYSQVELRMLAHMAKVDGLIDAFRQGIDVHTKTAMDVFRVSAEDVTPLMRRQAKAINFGIDYGMSEFGLAENLQISLYEARNFIDSYFRSYPQIRDFMNEQIEFCRQHGYVETLLKRRREIPEIHSSNRNIQQFGQRAAMNAPVQGSAADLMKIAMINVYNRLKKENLQAKLILQIHDELILNVPESEKDYVTSLVEDEMENAMTLLVPLVAEGTSGTNWLEVK
ncbi:MAG: DNA polymerase I [Erysipelotrichaceae bacterium]|nr:DNA polymerase I [Erysipelotrichaceae bacterium]